MSGYPQTPTFPIDLRGGKGIKVNRTGPTANTIVLDAILGNDALAPMAAGTLKANLLGSASIPQDVTLQAFGAALGLRALAYKDAAAISDVTGLQTALNGKQSSLGFTPENAATKGQPNGYAPLGTDGKVASAFLPAGNGGAITADLITDASASGKAVLKGTPAQARDALQLGGAAVLNVGTTAGTLVDGGDSRLAAAANAFQRGDNSFVGPNFATYTTAYSGVVADVGGLPRSCRAGGDTVGVTDVILGTVDLPYSSGNPRGIHAAGVAGIARTADPNMGALGVFGGAMANAAPGRVSQVFGGNFVVTNKPNFVPNVPNQGLENCELYGIEIDVACERTASGAIPNNVNIRGTWTTGNCEVMTNGLLCAHYVGFAGAFNKVPFKEGFRTMDEAARTALMAGFAPGSGAVGSATIELRSRDGGGTVRQGRISTDAGGNIVVEPGGGAAVSLAPGGISSAFILNVGNSLNVAGNAGVGGGLTVNGNIAAGSVGAGTFAANTSVTSPGVTCTNLSVSANIAYMGRNVQIGASNALPPPGYGSLIVQL